MLSTLVRLVRSQKLLVLVVVLGIASGGAIMLLLQHADASRRAQTQVGAVKFALADLQNAPFSADSHSGGSPAHARVEIRSDNRLIYGALQSLIAAGSPPAPLLQVSAAVRAAGPAIQQILKVGSSPGGIAGSPSSGQIDSRLATLQANVISGLGLLTRAQRTYGQRATSAKTEAVAGSFATIGVLLMFFALFYRRATRFSVENGRLLAASRNEAITDPLTGLGNRRAFKRDLEKLLPGVSAEGELMVAMFDLDGFKQYNDTFGHAAGDALLARISQRLQDNALGSASVYRLGGDEFCLITQTSVMDGERLVHSAVAALSDSGEGWRVGCSWGVAWMPSEVSGTSEALRLADERMYAQKASRATAGHQATAALIQVLIERDLELSTHISHVAELASATAQRLGLPEHEVTRISLAAQLHDIGKTAIPESILAKPGTLTPDEWAFVRSHTLVGERIIAAAPSLAHTAALVRSSHEQLDGTGYPDGLTAEQIPLGSKIIAACDAYDAMTTSRPYQTPRTMADAITELHRCSGTQFDFEVVEALCAILPDPVPLRPAHRADPELLTALAEPGSERANLTRQ